MSIPSTANRNDYIGNNSTATYAYGFKIFEASDLRVTQKNLSDVETLLVLYTDYTVTNAGNKNGGNVVLTAGNLATGYALTIRRVKEITQEFDLKNQGSYFPEIHEDAFDGFIMIDQQQQDEIDRSLKMPESISDFDATLPTTFVPGSSFLINEDGDGFIVGPTGTEIEGANASAIASAASAAAALVSQGAASTSATAAASSASSASTSASAASTSASSASTSATTATTQASAASTSATTATTQAGNASTSATAAATSATNASNSASAASTSATNAGNSATAAAGSATTASNAAASISGISGTGLVHSTSGTLSTSALINADVDAAAAIAGSKITPTFGAQAVSTTSTLAVGPGAANTNALSSIGASASPQTLLSGTTQYGHAVLFRANSSATSRAAALAVEANTDATAFTLGHAMGVRYLGLNIGAGSTVTRSTFMYGVISSGAGSNAWGADNESYSGNYILNFTSTNATSFGGRLNLGANDSASVGFRVSGTGPLTSAGTTSWGHYMDATAPTASTAAFYGSQSSPATTNSAYTTALVASYFSTFSKGASNTTTRFVNYLGTASTSATNNAFLADNSAFSGNYFLNQSGTTASLLSGPISFANELKTLKGTDFSTTGTSNDVSTSSMSLLRYTGASAATITGFANGSDGKQLTLMNASSSQVVLNNSDSGSSAANRIVTGTGANSTVAAGASVFLQYDSGASVWRMVGSSASSSAGGSGINYLPTNLIEYNFETAATTGWATAANTVAAATPEVTPGGSPNAAFTFTASSSSPLRGTYSGLITKDANNRQGHMVRTSAFTIDSADTGKALTISFDYQSNISANYVAGDVGVFISDGTNIITPSVTSLAASKGIFTANFASTTSTSYRLIFHVASTNATAYTIKVDNLSVGPNAMVVSSAIGDYQTYTPTIVGCGTVSGNTAFWRRAGDSIEVRGTWTMGTPSATPLTIGLPSGLTIDTTKLSADRTPFLGLLQRATSTGTSIPASGHGPWPIAADTAVTSSVYLSFNVDTANTLFSKTNGSSAANATDRMSYYFSVPIANWGSSVALATSTQEFASNTDATSGASNTTSFSTNGAAGSAIPALAIGTDGTRRVRFNTPIQPTDVLVLETQEAATGLWQSLEQFRGGLQYQSGNVYGARILKVSGSTTDVDVNFGAQGWRASGATYASNGTAWSGLNSNGDLWRVRKSAGVNSMQLSGNIVGVIDGSVAQPGTVGEKLSAVNSSGTSLTNNTITNITSKALTPGSWAIYGSASFGSGGTGVTQIQAMISTTGTTQTGQLYDGSVTTISGASASPGSSSVQVGPVFVDISATTTYYLNEQAGFSGGSITGRGTITAVRIR